MNCAICNKPLEKKPHQRKDHRYCSKTCANRGWLIATEGRKQCQVDGCARLVHSKDLCRLHYVRWKRFGQVDKYEAQPFIVNAQGYVQIRAQHPLSSGKYVYEHRMVLYDTLGPAPHVCYWCGKSLATWDEITVDHLDGVKGNNAPDNLVPACNGCNYVRGLIMPFISRCTDEGFRHLSELLAKARTQLV